MTETARMRPAPQRMRALQRANAVRLARAELKRRIVEGEVSAAGIILEPPHAAQSWAIGELLLSQRRWGDTRCRKFLSRNQINETKPLGTLTERQRHLLADQLETSASREYVAAEAPAPSEPGSYAPSEATGSRELALAHA
jgi:hypothetical protein